MGATFSRLKNWIDQEVLTHADLNAEINNILTNLTALGVDDYSASVGEMQTQVSPGAQGSESQATSVGGEIARLRYVIARLMGKTYWYDTPVINLETVNDTLNQVVALPTTRIVSGRMRGSGSTFPIYLTPSGVTNSVTLKAAVTDFVCYINGTALTVDADVTLTGLTVAPNTNNTCLINGSFFTDNESSKYFGEGELEFIVDTMGSNMSALVGQWIGFKIAGVTDEYALGYLKSSTRITNIRRGYFMDSADAPVLRTAFADNDTLTLMKLTYIFLKNDSTLEAVYTNLRYQDTAPTSPASGDYYFDTGDSKWYRYNGSSWVLANAILIGMCLQDDTKTVVARSERFFAFVKQANSMRLYPESSTVIRSTELGSRIAVMGKIFDYSYSQARWDITANLETGITEAASTMYALYVTDTGDFKISSIHPVPSPELLGDYHPFQNWACAGIAYNDGSSNLTQASGYNENNSRIFLTGGNGYGAVATKIRRYTTTSSVFGAAMTYADTANDGASFMIWQSGLYRFMLKDYSGAGGSFGISCNVNSSNLTTNIEDLSISTLGNRSHTLGHCYTELAGNSTNTFTATAYLFKGELVRPHTNATAGGTTATTVTFTVERVL